MTTESIALMELIEKPGDQDFLKELGQWTLQRLMELEVEQKVGAGPHERTEDRTTHRNGYRDRTLETRIGSLSLRIPKLRSGSYFPSFLEPRKKSEHALVAVVKEAYINGCRRVPRYSAVRTSYGLQACGKCGLENYGPAHILTGLDGFIAPRSGNVHRPIITFHFEEGVMTGERTIRHIGWAAATAGMRIAASITYIGLFSLVGRLIGAVEVHPALSPAIWVSAAVAVGLVYSALVSSRLTMHARRVRAAIALAALAIMLIRAFQIVSGPILIAIVGVVVVAGIVSLSLLFVQTPRFGAA